MRCVALLLAGVMAVSGSPMSAASGSWVASAPAVTVAVPGRWHWSQPLAAPEADVMRGAITTVVWRYRTAPGREVSVWLCAGRDHCVSLAGPRGQTRGLAGVPASTPLQLRYALPAGERQALVVSGVQLVVNHQ